MKSRTPPRRPLALATVFCLLALSPDGWGAATPDRHTAGLVVALEGCWRLTGSERELQAGDELPGAAVVEALPEQKGTLRIVIARMDLGSARAAEPELALECASADSCGRLTLPPAPPAESAWGRLADAVGAVLGRNYRRYRTTLARDLDGVPDVREAVVTLDGGTLDVASALEHVGAGTYQVELLPAPVDAQGTATTANLDWHPGGRAPLAASGVQAGLYELALAAPRPDAPAGRAWVWACPRDAVETCRARFAPVAQLAAALDGSGDRGVLRSFLRSALEHLAAETP